VKQVQFNIINWQKLIFLEVRVVSDTTQNLPKRRVYWAYSKLNSIHFPTTFFPDNFYQHCVFSSPLAVHFLWTFPIVRSTDTGKSLSGVKAAVA